MWYGYSATTRFQPGKHYLHYLDPAGYFFKIWANLGNLSRFFSLSITQGEYDPYLTLIHGFVASHMTNKCPLAALQVRGSWESTAERFSHSSDTS